MSTGSPEIIDRMTPMLCSSLARSAGFFPMVRTALSPRPIPMKTLSPMTEQRVAAILEVTVMCLVIGLVTKGPMLIFLVFWDQRVK